jgi:hypothetical protein
MTLDVTIDATTVSQINNATSLEELRRIAATKSAAALKSNGVLYSGYVSKLGKDVSAGNVAKGIAKDLNFSAITDTERGSLLISDDFDRAVEKLIRQDLVSKGYVPGSDAYKNAYKSVIDVFLNDAKTSVWAEELRRIKKN